MTNPNIDTVGNKRWYNQNGELHREDGPAIEYTNGDKSWYQNGKAHRLDGPALESANGTRFYFINDRELTEDEWKVHPFRIKYVIQKNLKSILND